MPTSKLTLPAALAGVLLLAACGEEETAKAPPPAEQGETKPAPGTAEDVGRELGEAGKALREGAETLAEKGRQALEEAGPTLERAGDVAKQIGRSVDEIVKQGVKDFNTAVDELQKRIDESAGNTIAPTGDPQAVLAQPDRLKADTRAAARARPAGIGPAYVGVWASDAASCAKIDVEPVEMFAVITPTTIRRYENVCNFAAADLTDGKATIAASCIAEGDTEERQIELAMTGDDALRISTPGAEGAAALIRCHLPQ